jgi:hypothetical protein
MDGLSSSTKLPNVLSLVEFNLIKAEFLLVWRVSLRYGAGGGGGGEGWGLHFEEVGDAAAREVDVGSC